MDPFLISSLVLFTVQHLHSVSVPEYIVDVSHGHILGLGQQAPGQGQGGQHEAAAEVEGAPQVEAGLQHRVQLEASHHQQEAQGPRQSLNQ